MDIQAIGVSQTPQPETRGSITRKASASERDIPVAAKAPPAPAPTSQQLQKIVDTINSRLSSSTSLEFSLDQGSGKTVVRVADRETGEVIRQIPSDTALAIAESIGEFQKGLLLRQEA